MKNKPSQETPFRDALLRNTLQVGTFQKTPSMIISEVLAQTPLQVVCLDAEHAPFGRTELDQCVFALRSSGMPSIVRVQANSPEYIGYALDCGATGVMVPHVNSADKAHTALQSVYYGVHGRGYAGSTRSAGYATRSISENCKDNRTRNIMIAQIEDASAVECIEEIVAVEGLESIFIGMADLAVSLGCNSLLDEKVKNAAVHICQAAKQAQCSIGIFVADVNQIPFWREQGVRLFLLGSEQSFIQQGAKAMVQTFA